MRSIGAARSIEGGLGDAHGHGGSSAASWFGDLGVMASAVQMIGKCVQVKERLRAARGTRGAAYFVCFLDSDSTAVVKAQYAFDPADYFVHEYRINALQVHCILPVGYLQMRDGREAQSVSALGGGGG